MLLTTLIVTGAVLLASLVPASAHEGLNLMPASVLLYEQRKAELPRSRFDLNPCRLLARGPRGVPFEGWPEDREPGLCDLSRVVVAFGGWCYSGVTDAGPDGPHFSQSIMPVIVIDTYDDGTVIRVQHVKKRYAPLTPEGEAAAVTFLKGPLPAMLDVRGRSWDIFGNLEPVLPLRKGTP